jgi:polyphosphate kinase 2
VAPKDESMSKSDKKKKKDRPAPPTVAVCPVLSLANLYDRPPGRPEEWYTAKGQLKNGPYERELGQLQVELVKLQEWVRQEKRKVVVVFEGRDAAGKGGAIKRVVEKLNPRVCRIAALPVPTEREQTQWYFQRYVMHLPSGGEIVLFDRSWYNRALVERVMGFCSDKEYQEFARAVPEFERMLVRSGTILIKYWFSISDEEQERRFQARIHNPLKRWKLSPMDLESRRLYREYSIAKDEMMEFSDIPEAPWWTVPADDKRRARLNCIAHLLSCVPYEDVMPDPPSLPPREKAPEHRRPHVQRQNFTPIIY